jgi:hypothetical protein
VPDIRIVEYPPPNISSQSAAAVRKHAEAIVDEVIKALTQEAKGSSKEAAKAVESKPREIIFTGAFEEVNKFFYANQWTDGLPIIPPTIGKVEEFLRYTDRSPDEVIGVFPPANREGTIWKVAVNGVMAGCRPEYMPVLIAAAEAMVDPKFPLIDAGTTGGTAPWLIINGPIARQLDFNSSTCVLCPGRQANSTVGRFLRLVMINLSRFLPGVTDMSAFGWPAKFSMCLAEAEDQSPWEPLSVERGFKPGISTVTAVTALIMSEAFLTEGDKGEEHLMGVATEVAKGASLSLITRDTRYTVVVLSPLIARIINGSGYSKQAVKKYLYENARTPAATVSKALGGYARSVDLCELAAKGMLRKEYCTTDPAKMLPIVHSPEEFVIVVSGNPVRNRSFAAYQTRKHPVTKEITLPANWEELLREAQK